ncbi:MAG: efflux RND transporter permease subunit [Bdellovibrionales bacterium]
MKLTKLSIDRPVFAWMLMASLIVFGGMSFKFLGVSSLPDVDFPTVNISVGYTGASPEVIESDVVDIIESAVMGAEGLKGISSSSKFGSANITLEFNINRSIDAAMQEVQNKVSQTLKRLPKNVDYPIITKQNPEDQPIMWISLSGSLPAREIMSYARDKVIPQFQLIDGVGDVFLSGYLEPNLRVWIDSQKLKKYELSIDDITGAISREHIESPVGILQDKNIEYSLRVIGETVSVTDFENIIISRRSGSPIYTQLRLKDIAKVELGTEDVRKYSRVLGENAVGLGIRKQRGSNAVQVAALVKDRMALVQNSLPQGLKMGVNFDSTKVIKETVNELEFELVLSAILTGIVCWLFLGSLQSTFNILLAIPTSLIGTFIGIKFFGFTLNSFTFLGLILAVGIVVDDSIMILENIVRHRKMGRSKYQAALEGTNQVSFAALVTTLAIVAIFLPIAFIDGVIGKFFFQFGVTISVAVGLSLLESLTLTPMRCSQFLEEEEKTGLLEKLVHSLTVYYQKGLKWCLHHRGLVLVLSTLVFLLSFYFMKNLKKEFVPSQDQGIFLVRLTTDIGSSLDYTDSLVRQAEEKLKSQKDIERFFVAVGGFGGGQVNTAILFVTLKDHNKRKISQQQMMDIVRKEFSSIKGLRTIIQDLSQGGFGGGRGFPIEFSVRGPDWTTLVEKSKEIIVKLKADPRFIDVDTNYNEGVPEIQVIPNRARATQLGISISDLSSAISTLIGGQSVSRFTEGGKRMEVRLQLAPEFREHPESVLGFSIRNNRGELIPLKEVAKVEIKKSLVSITRESRERAITIYSNVAAKASQADMTTYIESLRKTLPLQYSIMFSGSSKSFSESFTSLFFALWFGILIAYMILSAQFNSFVHGFTVLLALPFSATGAFFALWVANSSLNIYSLIGLILLMGIVKKNSIMLVDFTNQIRASGKSVYDSLIEACPLRLRPILMTSVTIVAASLPPVLGLGPGTETRSSMSLAVMGGVILSTVLTLFVVPCVYSLLSRDRNT